MKPGSDLLQIFRLKVDLLMSQYADRLKVAVVLNRIKGISNAAIKAQKERGLNRWDVELDKLKRDIKREVGGLIAGAFHRAYLDGLKPRGK